MLRTRVLCIAVIALSVVPAAALATPQLAQDENGASTLLMTVLTQPSRSLLGASTGPDGAFGPLAPVAPTRYFNPDRLRLAVDEQGGAVAAWAGEAQGDGYTYNGVFVSIKAPGGEFGPPELISAPGNQVGEVALDVNARGDAVAMWIDYRNGIRYSFRPAGGSFGAEAAVPGPITHDPYVVLEADGGALFLGDDTPPTSPAAVYRRPDGTFADPTHLDGVPSLYGNVAVAGNRRGDVLLAWADDGGVKVRERPAGGSFGPVEQAATGIGSPGYGNAVTATMNDSGDALLVFSGSPVSVLARAGGGQFERLAVPGASGAITAMAMNERGQAAVATAGSDRVRVAYKPAGQPFDQTRALGPVEFGFVRPTLAIDGQGTATAVWEDSDGETDVVRSRSFTHDGAGNPSTIGSVPTYVQEAPPEGCVAHGQAVVARSTRAVIARFTAYATYTGCLLARGAPVDLAAPWLVPVGDFTDVKLPATVAVAGPFAAAVVSAHGHDGSTSSWVSIVDLRDESSGGSHFGPTLSNPFVDVEVPALRLAPTGSAAWVSFQGAGRKRFARPRATVKYVYVLPVGSYTPRQVGRGKRIAPASLRLRDGRVSWRNGKRRHSAPVG